MKEKVTLFTTRWKKWTTKYVPIIEALEEELADLWIKLNRSKIMQHYNQRKRSKFESFKGYMREQYNDAILEHNHSRWQ